MREICSVGCTLPSVGRVLPSIKLVEEGQARDATGMEEVRKGMKRAGKREIRAFCDEECTREAQDRPRKAQAAGAERQGKEFQRQACNAVIEGAALNGHFPIGSFPRLTSSENS